MGVGRKGLRPWPPIPSWLRRAGPDEARMRIGRSVFGPELWFWARRSTGSRKCAQPEVAAEKPVDGFSVWTLLRRFNKS